MEITEKKPKVSVTVVTYNHGHWLAECLESIVTQETDFLFEVIVGDDASTDGLTQKVLQDYAGRYPDLIVPVFREHNIGPTQNYFDVVRRTQGEYIAHIDGDDRMLPGKLQKQVDFLDAHPECSIVTHDVRVFDAITNKVLRTFSKPDVPEISDIVYLVKQGSFFAHSSKMYRRIANTVWQRDEPTIDFFLHLEHASNGKIGFIRDILGEQRKNLGSISNFRSIYYNDIITSGLQSIEKVLSLGVPKAIACQTEIHFRYSYAVNSLLAGRYEKCCQLLMVRPTMIRWFTPKFFILLVLSKIPFILPILRWIMINYLKNKS